MGSRHRRAQRGAAAGAPCYAARFPMAIHGAAAAPAGGDTFVSPALGALERERYVAYSALVRNLHWLAAALVVLYAVLLRRGDRLTLYALAAAMVVYTLALHWPPLAGRLTRGRIGLEAIL